MRRLAGSTSARKVVIPLSPAASARWASRIVPRPAALEVVGDRECDFRPGRVHTQVGAVADRAVVLPAKGEQAVAAAVVDVGHQLRRTGEVGRPGEEAKRLRHRVEAGEQLLEQLDVVGAHRAQADGRAVVEDDVGLAVVRVGRRSSRSHPARRAGRGTRRTRRAASGRGNARGPAGAPARRSRRRARGPRPGERIASARASRSWGSSIRSPLSPSTIWSWIPPTRVPTTGRRFHIASATVSPNPSAMLFWTTMSARRCSALTIAAFSSMSSIGRLTRWIRCRRLSSGSSRQAVSTSRQTASPSGSSETDAEGRAGEDEMEVLVGEVPREAAEQADDGP